MFDDVKLKYSSLITQLRAKLAQLAEEKRFYDELIAALDANISTGNDYLTTKLNEIIASLPR